MRPACPHSLNGYGGLSSAETARPGRTSQLARDHHGGASTDRNEADAPGRGIERDDLIAQLEDDQVAGEEGRIAGGPVDEGQLKRGRILLLRSRVHQVDPL